MFGFNWDIRYWKLDKIINLDASYPLEYKCKKIDEWFASSVFGCKWSRSLRNS